jgi:hypothetical protein
MVAGAGASRSTQAAPKALRANREFGLLFSVIAIAASFSPRIRRSVGPEALWLVAGVLFVAVVVKPGVLSPVRRLWLSFGDALHRLLSPVLIALVFFGVLTPIAAGARLFRRVSRQASKSGDTRSYWVHRAPGAPAPQSMQDQF